MDYRGGQNDYTSEYFGTNCTSYWQLYWMGNIERNNKEFIVTATGEVFFKDFGIDLAGLSKKRRSFSHACLDWSERTHHLGGALGNGLI